MIFETERNGVMLGTLEGFDLTARVEPDTDPGEPWKEEDGHGVISGWERRDKAPSERILFEDHGSRLFYDIAASMKKAKVEGWDAPPYGGTPGERAARAVDADFRRMQAYCRGDWGYYVVIVTASRDGIELGSAALGWIESDSGDYLKEIAEELANEAVEHARETIKGLCAA